MTLLALKVPGSFPLRPLPLLLLGTKIKHTRSSAFEKGCFSLKSIFAPVSGDHALPSCSRSLSDALRAPAGVAVRWPSLKQPSAREALRVKPVSCPGTFGDFSSRHSLCRPPGPLENSGRQPAPRAHLGTATGGPAWLQHLWGPRADQGRGSQLHQDEGCGPSGNGVRRALPHAEAIQGLACVPGSAGVALRRSPHVGLGFPV